MKTLRFLKELLKLFLLFPLLNLKLKFLRLRKRVMILKRRLKIMAKKKTPLKKKPLKSVSEPEPELEEKGGREESEEFPEYPPQEKSEKAKKRVSSPGTDEEEFEEEEFEDETDEVLSPEEVEGVCGEIYGGFYEIWNIFRPSIRTLSLKEKTQVKKVLSRIVIRKGLVKYAKDEFLLLFYVSLHVGSRLKEIREAEKGKPDDIDDSGEEREREDNTIQKPDKKT